MDAVEYQVAPMHPAPDAVVFVARDHRPGLRHLGQLQAAAGEVAQETESARDMVAERLQIRLGRGGELDDHSGAASALRYFASSRARTSAAGRVRPASASARLRASA